MQKRLPSGDYLRPQKACFVLFDINRSQFGMVNIFNTKWRKMRPALFERRKTSSKCRSYAKYHIKTRHIQIRFLIVRSYRVEFCNAEFTYFCVTRDITSSNTSSECPILTRISRAFGFFGTGATGFPHCPLSTNGPNLQMT